jgi:hypothetical protein
VSRNQAAIDSSMSKVSKRVEELGHVLAGHDAL